jgi:hypothetical protein
MLVGLAMMRNPHLRAPGLPDLFYAERVRALVAKACCSLNATSAAWPLARSAFPKLFGDPDQAIHQGAAHSQGEVSVPWARPLQAHLTD